MAPVAFVSRRQQTACGLMRTGSDKVELLPQRFAHRDERAAIGERARFDPEHGVRAVDDLPERPPTRFVEFVQDMADEQGDWCASLRRVAHSLFHGNVWKEILSAFSRKPPG